MTIAKLIALRAESVPVSQLAHDSLRYEAVRSLTGEQFFALNRAAILDHRPGEDFNSSFDRNVDMILVARASERGADL